MADSRVATYEHIQAVQGVMARVIADLQRRQLVHDRSKLEPPEVEIFDEYTPKLAATTYGSDEYRGYLVAMRPGLDHHYAVNDHHPECFRWHCPACDASYSDEQVPGNRWDDGTVRRFCPRCCGPSVIWECELDEKPGRGIRGMSLVALLEMLCDWLAATKRHADGDIRRSIEVNQKRFGYSDELKQILLNTLRLIEG